MKQRVNIQYSIDMEELEPEVSRLIDSVERRIENLHNNTSSEFVSDLLSLSTLTSVENIRIELANIDFMLADITKIINAYISYRSQQVAAAVEAPPQGHESPQQNVQPRADDGAAILDQSELLKRMENLRTGHGTIAKPNDKTTQT